MSTQRNKAVLVKEVMLDLSRVPVVQEATMFKEALEEMGRAGLGILCIVNNNNQLQGILTDGDIRRKLLKVQKPFSAFFVDDALDHSIRSPIVISSNDMLGNAINLMERKQIWDLPVIDDNALVGLLHLHPAVKALLEA